MTTKLAGSVRVYVNSLAVPQVMNFMSMQSMLVKAHPIKGPILRSVLIFMGILSPSILIVHEFDLVLKSAFYQLGSWTILKQMSWYLYIDVELQLAYNVINWSDAIKSKWIERLAIFFCRQRKSALQSVFSKSFQTWFCWGRWHCDGRSHDQVWTIYRVA